MLRFVILVLCVAVAAAELETVDELDITKYVGRWYQMYGNLLSEFFGPGETACSVADYYALNDTTVSVRNSGKKETVDGDDLLIRGTAVATEETGKFILDLNLGFKGTYWVLKLGPVNEDGLYDYAIVSDQDGITLFILARDRDVFRAKYDEETVSHARGLGFDNLLNEPKVQYQGEDCPYLEP